MALSDELAWKSAAEIALMIRRKALSPVEVLEATIARIEKRNPSITALVYYGFDDARAAARKAEKALMGGDPIGPLHGVPSAIKDLFDFKPGWPATFGGLPSQKNHVVDGYCGYSERIEKAGAVLLGKTNSPVMGFRGCCDNLLFGPTGTPFDTSRNSGGSSGGSAAAVGDGMLSFAEGTDGGGSIRIPSSWSGVYGYKPAYGRVPQLSRPNAFGGHAPFLFEGPIARTVEDAALVMTAIGGYDSRDAFCLDETVDYLGALRRSIRGWKIAYAPVWDVFPVEAAVRETVDKAVRAFEEAGAIVEEVKLGIERPQGELADLWCRMIMPLNLAAFDLLKENGLDLLGDHADEFPPEYLEWVEVGRRMSAVDFYRDQEIRTEVFDAIRSTLDRYDLIVGPTLCCLPVKNAAERGRTKGPTEINGEAVNPLIGWCPTYLINYTGNPAATVPAGLAGGLPVGMQIVGRRYADSDVLAASAAFERLRPWMGTYAKVESRPL
ncbi:MAG: amidase family protein [Alphaproteobacteria bacterium]